VNDTIVALATPAGQGAIGLVRLSGARAPAVAERLARRAAPFPARRPVLAWLHDGEERLDQALVTLFPAGESYTGEDLVEFSAHGSPYVLERLVELCVQAGARPAEPGEFTQRAFLAGRMDLAQAEAVCGLIAARTRHAHRAAVRQLEGGLSRRVRELRGRLLDIASDMEACLDHPDDVSPADSTRRLTEVRDALLALASGFTRGRLLREGTHAAIAGRPNAGKSSLFNALLARDRSIVHEAPGTTRDALSESCDLGGMPFVLTDTAGLSEDASGPVEAEGMSRARSALTGADLVLAVLDRSQPAADALSLLAELRTLARDAPLVAALNKSDLPPAFGPEALPVPSVETCALTGAGVEALAALLRGSEPASDASLVTSERHHGALLRSAEEAETALGAPTADIAAALVRRSLAELDAIVSADGTAEVLDGVFSKFCVGK